MGVPIASHHIHFYNSPIEDTRAWYVKTFGAVPGKRDVFEAADIPGINLSFSASTHPIGRDQRPRSRSYWVRGEEPGGVLQEIGRCGY